ncbi:ABC transporter [Streptomyces caatingaensis]|uniref:ABC transporter n=1 Tax=Streptomyces caatingaensis TaxID=1678637 RepID=A0A0K9XMJ0_9ACTN|nr:ABC transporter [Streptomyces caatingaensis]
MWGGPRARSEAPLSESERLLFSGALRHDKKWAVYEDPLLRMSLWSMARQFPSMLATVCRVAWGVDRAALLVVFGTNLAAGLMTAFGLVATNQVLVHLFAAGPTAERLREALPALLSAGAVAGVSVALGSWSVMYAGRLYPKIELAYTARYYRGMARCEMAALENKDIYKVLAAGRYGTDSVKRMLRYAVDILHDVVGFAASALVLALLNPLLVAALALIAVPRWLAAVAVVRRTYASMHVWLDHTRAVDTITYPITRVDVSAEVRVHGAGKLLMDAHADMAATAAREKARLARAEAGTELAGSAASGLGRLCAYGLLWLLLTSGGMPLAAAGTAVLAIRTSTGYLAGLVMQFNHMVEESMYLGDLDEACALTARHAIPEGGRDVPRGGFDVVLDRVSFRYPNTDKYALRDVSLEIPRGKVVALVGENGSGKTTLAGLVAGLYLPTDGTLAFGGVDVREADRQQVFDQIAVLSQEIAHWPMTVRANIHIGRSTVPRRDIQRRAERAAAEADVLGVIEDLPHGWDSIAVKGFERGVKLSGGQWQKLATARALYRDAPLLIVDEPTAALDPKKEIETFAALRELTDDGTTVLMITHRLAATATADLIHVLRDGHLIESGTHTELMSVEGGHYRELYELQAAQYGNGSGTVPAPRKEQPAGT